MPDNVINPVATADERRAQKAVATAAAKAAKVRAEEPAPAAETAAEPVAAEPLPVEPEAPVIVETPDAPMYNVGDKVKSMDPARMDGVVKSAGVKCYSYEIETADGGIYVECESQMEPASEEEPALEDEIMTDETVAPAALAQSVGLNVGATLGECSAAALATRAELERERSEACKAACLAAGMHADLVDDYAPKITRAEGETWDAAVAAHKAVKPGAYKAEAAAPVEQTPAPVAPVANRPKLPAGTVLGENKTPPAKEPAAKPYNSAARMSAAGRN